MQINTSRASRVETFNLVVALFTDEIAASDAVADLQLAGFHANQIGIALSRDNSQRGVIAPAVADQDAIAAGKHSFFWKLRHSIEHDTHAQGVGFDSRRDENRAQAHDALYSKVDLEDTLLGLGVAEERIRLLDQEIGATGMLMLVDSGHHCSQVQSILERNRGIIRTDMATERAHH